MANAIDYTEVQGYKSYVETFSDKLISKLFHGFPSAKLFTAHEGVKGKHVLTQLAVNKLVRRYSKTWTPEEAAKFVPRVLEVAQNKMDLEFIPKELESSYVGHCRQKGQDPMDFPFQEYVLDLLMQQIQEEQEEAIWTGVASATPATTDRLNETFDGIVKLVSTEVTAGNLTATTTGALTDTNTVAAVESMYKKLGKAYKYKTIDVFASLGMREKYITDYRERFSKNWGDTDSVRFDIGNANFNFLPGVPDDFIMITPKENIHYGYDAEADATLFNFEQRDRTLKVWCDFNMGVQLGLVSDDCIIVNDAALIP